MGNSIDRSYIALRPHAVCPPLDIHNNPTTHGESAIEANPSNGHLRAHPCGARSADLPSSPAILNFYYPDAGLASSRRVRSTAACLGSNTRGATVQPQAPASSPVLQIELASGASRTVAYLTSAMTTTARRNLRISFRGRMAETARTDGRTVGPG